MLHLNRFVAVFALWSALLSSAAFAQCVNLTTLGVASTQNFDTLSNTAGSTTNNLTITGWFMTETGGGARDNEQYAVDTGASNTGDTFSYGAAGATDRALGALQSGTLIPLFGACFTNNTGATVSSLDLQYTGEQWRLGTTARTDQINFEFSTDATSLTTGAWTGVAALNFVSPDTGTTGAKNGNGAANRTVLTQSIPALSIANGATFWIRWTDTNASGADDGLSVDDFSLTPQGGVVLPTLSINDVTLAEGNAGTTTFSFTVALSAPAGPGGVTFDITSADNTATLANNDYVLNSLNGQTIPAGSSTYNFDVSVNGDAVTEANETFFVNVTNVVGATVVDGQGQGTANNDDSITLSPGTLPDTTVPATYNQAITANGGIAPYGFAVSLGALPNGLALSPAGLLSGQATEVGTFNFTVTATDASGAPGPFFGSQAYTINVNAPTLTMTPPAGNLNATFNVMFSQGFAAAGGTGPYAYVLTGALPTGLSFTGDTLSGTPIQTGNFPITVTATDSGTTGVGAPFSISQNYTVVVGATPIVANADVGTVANGSVGGVAVANVLVNDTLNAAPATLATVTLSQVSTSNPNVTLNLGTASVDVAPATAADTATVIYQICEQANPGNCATASVTVTVGAAVIDAVDDTGTVANGAVGGVAVANVLVNDTLGGVPATLATVTLSQVSTSNANVTLNAGTAAVSAAPGTPAGVHTVTYQICQQLNPANCDSANAAVTVGAAVIDAVDDAGGIAASTGGTAIADVLVNDTLGGVPATLATVTLSQISTDNPNVTLNAGTGAITVVAGPPAGVFTVVYQVCEALNPANCDTANAVVTVAAPTIVINSGGLPTPALSVPYNGVLGASGGTAPYSFAVTAGTLPGGLTLIPDGTLTGTPSGIGSFTFTVTATDAQGFTGTAQITLVVGGAQIAIPTLSTIGLLLAMLLIFGLGLRAIRLSA